MKRKLMFGILILAFLFSGCTAALQQAWDSKTPDEQARIVVSGLQKSLNQKFDEAKAVVAMNPQYQELWKLQIVPAFDKANKTLAKLLILANSGKTDPATVYAAYKPELDALMLYLIKIGMKA
jgi:hypothetical protein